jgi:imidazolonepropionase-like amidohydrolase
VNAKRDDAAMLRCLARVALAVIAAADLRAQQPIALVGATVHSGDGSPPIANGIVVVRGAKIEAIGAADTTKIPDGAQRVDLAGKHVTPGLIDTHVHYSQTGWADGRPDAANVRERFPYEQAMADNQAHPERFHRAFLHAGVTAVFDVGGYPWTLQLAAKTENDPLAPHVAAAGPLLATWDPKLSLPDAVQFVFPTTPDEGRTAVKAHRAAGSVAIKFWYVVREGGDVAKWSPVLRAIGDEAKAAGLPLIVHATTLDSAKDAVAAGAKLLVHSVEDRPVDDDFVRACVAAGTFYCPTLTVRAGYRMLYAAKANDEVLAQLDTVHPTVAERVRATSTLSPRNPAVLANVDRMLARQGETMAANLRALRDAGVRIVLGTDAGNPLTLHGPSVFVELEAMAAAGMTPAQVLVAATRDAAAAMGRGDDLGVLAKGRVADLLVLPDDPERDVRAFRGVTHVMRAGALHERKALLPR